MLTRSLLIGSLTLAACEDNVADKTDQAAERVKLAARQLRQERSELANAERTNDKIADEVEDVNREAAGLAKAQEEYANQRALRIESLRAEHSVAASQPVLIQVLANAKSLLPTRRARLDESLSIFRQRLATTRHAIEELQYVPAADWERRDDELRRAMAGMFLARDASWQLLDEKPTDVKFPET